MTNVPLGGKPEYAASSGDGKVYANLTDTNEVVEINSKAAKVTRRWSTEACKQPVSMAICTLASNCTQLGTDASSHGNGEHCA